MITEDYVSFETAKLLKEKGFNWPCYTCYLNEELSHYDYLSTNFELVDNAISAPTPQMVMKWLREVHNIFIEIYLPSHSEHEDTIYHGTYSFDIFNLNTKVYVYCTWNEKEFNSYEEAITAAIKYCLENLI